MRQGAKSKQMCVLKAMFEMFYGWAAIKYATKGSFRPFFGAAGAKKGPKKRRERVSPPAGDDSGRCPKTLRGCPKTSTKHLSLLQRRRGTACGG